MERGVGLAARDGSEGCVVGDRLEDLRGWWQRTRRRRLKPAVQAAVGRGRPTAATHPAEPAPPPPDPSDEPAAVTAELPEPTEPETVEPEPEAEPVEQPEAEPVEQPDSERVEPESVEPPEPSVELTAPDPEQIEQVGPEPAQSDPEPVEQPEPSAAPVESGPEPVEQPDAAQVERAPVEPVEPEPKPADTHQSESEAEPGPASTGQAAVPEFAWAAPGSAPWEVNPAEPAAPDAGPAAPDAVAAVDASDAAALDADAPRTSDDPSAPWWGVAPPSAAESVSPAESVTPADPDPTLAPGPAAASTPDAAAAARSDDPLDLDDDQRRWLGRGVGLVEGIGPAYGSQLEAVGVSTLQDLLLRGATRRGRQEIADRTGISGRLIMRWVNNADLFRIRGVGTQYADLLEASGVDTVVELALRRPDNLTSRLKTTNDIRSLVHQVPTDAQVADWVAQAKELPRIVAY